MWRVQITLVCRACRDRKEDDRYWTYPRECFRTEVYETDFDKPLSRKENKLTKKCPIKTSDDADWKQVHIHKEEVKEAKGSA